MSSHMTYCVHTSVQLCHHICLNSPLCLSNCVITSVQRGHRVGQLFNHVYQTVSARLANCFIMSVKLCHHVFSSMLPQCHHVCATVSQYMSKCATTSCQITTSVPSSVITSAQIFYLVCQIVSPRLTNCVTTFVHLCHHLCPTLSRRRPTM